MSELLLDRAGRRRSPATMPGCHAGHAPGNKALRYPADPSNVEEIIAVMRSAGDRAHRRRLRALIAILWRSGLRIQEALALSEGDLANGTTRGRHWTAAAARAELRRTGAAARVRRRFAPYQLRYATPSRWPAKACQ